MGVQRGGVILLDIPPGMDEHLGVEIWTHEPTVAELDGFAARVEATER